MSGGYVTVAVLIQLGLIPCSEVDPLFTGLIRELLRTLQWCCNGVLTGLGTYVINKRRRHGLFEIKVVEPLNRTIELLVIL